MYGGLVEVRYTNTQPGHVLLDSDDTGRWARITERDRFGPPCWPSLEVEYSDGLRFGGEGLSPNFAIKRAYEFVAGKTYPPAASLDARDVARARKAAQEQEAP